MADTVLKPLKWMTKSIDDMAVKIIQKIPDFADKVIDALIFASEKICQQGWIPQWVKNGVIKMTTSFTINISSIFTKAVIKAPDAIIEGASGAKGPKFSENFNKWDDMKNAHKGTVTQFVKDNKPLGATHPRDWLKNGGSLTIETFDDKTQIWKYTKDGITVPYVPKMVKGKMQNVVKFPDEYLYKVDGVFESSFKVPEGFTGNRTIDMKNAIKHLDNTYGIDEIPKGYILHHDIDNGVFQLVRSDVHSGFSHYGGHYYNK